MKMIFFWLSIGIFAVLFIIQMITVIPLLKKDTSPEKKSSRQPIIRILNSLMIVFAGIEVAIGIGAFYSGIAISAVGFLNLLLSVMKIFIKKNNN